ncbi:phosphatidylinositol N-acetylglucosaminyltransferase subunit Y-like [Branchiostoma floridae]|uniref:Phosphatidylinositol N-acetylglucosaminyltransferase subunit Y-like n=1 Tax=Branchiostoma floridae TaxID=7739 RepID=A0A9J7MSE5_BRAFL|nr:phosphatidylinositol N-acetylglucosaminyltransferase subunit Y-like [Branchiostoma floridae]
MADLWRFPALLTVIWGSVGIFLYGIFFTDHGEKGFPHGCVDPAYWCYYSLLIPVTAPMAVFFLFLNWLGLKFFRHN